jgi:succinate dehydrogenase / fumarate reductase membrane anchor subunit
MSETKFWTWHMLAGVVILLLLGFHMVYTHAGNLTGIAVADRSEEAVSQANSLARDARPLYPVFFTLLLGIALYHGLYGLKNILFELTLKPAAERAISVVLLLAGLGLFGLGTWAAWTVHFAAAAGGRS